MERTDDILALLKQKKKMTVHELCAAFYCSPATIRRELATLEKTGAIKRMRGGAVLRSGTNFDYSALYRMNVNIKEKQYICSLAQDFIRSGMSLFLDSSSTVEQLCPHIGETPNISVLTNGINTALILNANEKTDTYITGGYIEHGSNTVLGELAGDFTDKFCADLAFISCRGLDKQGAYEANHLQCLTKSHMIAHAKETILLCDSTKFGKAYFHRLGTFDRFSVIITDKKPDSEVCEAIEKAGCELIY